MPASHSGRFVFAVASPEHAAGLSVSLAFLRRVTRAEIIVVQRAGDPPAPHNQRLEVEVPTGLSAHQAAIWLKTRLHRLIGLDRPFCYLNSDVLALTPEIDQVFIAVASTLAFASDNVTLDDFSRYAVRCGCATACPHLREALYCDFSTDAAPDFQLWNGGVFVARQGAGTLLDDWHEMATTIFTNPYWHTRDQGVLAGAIWRAGMQNAPRLPARFNTIIDCFDNIPIPRRATTPPAALAQFPAHLPLPQAVAAHFINRGIGRTGWPHWDNLSRLLDTQS